MAFTQQLTPEQIAYLQRRAQEGVTNVGGDAGGYTTGPFDWRYDTYSDPNTYGVYDDGGKLLDTRSKESSSAQAMRFLAGAGAMYGLGSLINGGMLGMGGGAGAGGGIGADAATSAAWQSGAGLGGDTLSAMGITESAAPGLSASAVAPAASSMLPAFSPAVAPGAGSVLGGLSGAMQGLGPLGNLIGAGLGAASARDQQQSAQQTSTSKTTKDPYAAAVPFINQMIGQGQQLATQYQQQPFSAAQQQAYGNFSGLLNAINGGAPGLMQGMGAAASGANNFDRSNPRKALQGGSFSLGGWAPGLLQLLGGKG